MSTFNWIYTSENVKPEQNEVVNVLAKDYITGKRLQFLAIYTSYRAAGKQHEVWTPLGGQFLFDDSSVSAWCRRLEAPSFRYSNYSD